MIPVVTPKILKRLFPQFIWDIPTTNKIVYLTFDDGPEPEITSQVLALLANYKAKSTFFCTGEKVNKNPETMKLLNDNSHAIGNHGYSHISGFSTANSAYYNNCIAGMQVTQSLLYRPPYGRITPKQAKMLIPQHKIILWSILSKDYSRFTTPDICANNVVQNVYPGAIVVFHDTRQAAKNLLPALPLILESLLDKGYEFGVLC
jgi:peptidoglycan/xylan/chitin deacetylase (PgdA/CDA1 family)